MLTAAAPCTTVSPMAFAIAVTLPALSAVRRPDAESMVASVGLLDRQKKLSTGPHAPPPPSVALKRKVSPTFMLTLAGVTAGPTSEQATAVVVVGVAPTTASPHATNALMLKNNRTRPNIFSS